VGTVDNETADILNGVISALMTGGEAAAELFVTGLAPEVFGNPIMQWLLDEGIGYIGQILSIAGQKFVDSLVIDAQTNWEKSDVLNAGTTLALAIASKDQAAITSATAALSGAYKSIISFDGWSTPK
jgi:hypothetical protein